MSSGYEEGAASGLFLGEGCVFGVSGAGGGGGGGTTGGRKY